MYFELGVLGAVWVTAFICNIFFRKHKAAIEGHHRRIGELEEEVNVLERVVRRVEAEQSKTAGTGPARTTDVNSGGIFPSSGDFSNLHYPFQSRVPNH